MKTEPWYAETTSVSSLEAEVCFQLQPHFYYGPDDPVRIADLDRLVVPLIPPEIPRVVPSMVRTSEIAGHEDQLISFYEQIVRVACKHNKSFNSFRHHFWLRFWLWNTEQKIHISFPWYDTFSEIESFISTVVNNESGSVVHDQDQGWEMEVHAQNGTLYFRQRDPDRDETHLAISTPRDPLIEQLATLRVRTMTIIERLSEALGDDVWTEFFYEEPTFRIQPNS